MHRGEGGGWRGAHADIIGPAGLRVPLHVVLSVAGVASALVVASILGAARVRVLARPPLAPGWSGLRALAPFEGPDDGIG